MRALVLVPLFLAAQQQPPGVASVEGRVLNQITGEGVRKAIVTLESGEGRSMQRWSFITTPDGTFRAEGLPAGRYRIRSERTGFVARFLREPFSVTPGGTSHAPEIRMMPHAVITGRITDEDGDPVQGASIQASRYQYSAGRRMLMPVSSAGTNDLGEFRMHGLSPGRYIVSATRMGFGGRGSGPGPGPGGPPWMMARSTEQLHYATVYHPGTVDPVAASMVDIAAGQEFRGMDLRMFKVPVVTVRGVVAGTEAAPGEGARRGGGPGAVVYYYPRSDARYLPGERRPAQVDPRTGKFELLGVRPGSYTLIAQQHLGRNTRVGVSLLDVGHSDIGEVKISVTDRPNVKGTVAIEGGQTTADLKTVLLQLFPSIGFDSGQTAHPEDSGSFEFEATPVPHRVGVLQVPAGFHLKSIEWAGQEAPGGVIDLTHGGGSELRIKLAPGVGSISGVVRNDKGDPVPSVKVTIAPESKYAAWFEMYKEAFAGPDGVFQFDNLRPGSYRVYAWESIENGAHQDAEFLKAFETQSSPVSVELGATATVHPKPIRVGGNSVL